MKWRRGSSGAPFSPQEREKGIPLLVTKNDSRLKAKSAGARRACSKPSRGRGETCHARTDAAASAADFRSDRLRRDVAWRSSDRFARPGRPFHRSDYSQVAARAKRVAAALDGLGVGLGDRVATLAWNSYRHLEAYYGITSSGRVLHTVNPRLFPEQLQYIMDHAENGFVFFDPIFAPLVEKLAPNLPLVRGWIALCDSGQMPKLEVRICSATKNWWRRRPQTMTGHNSTRMRPARSATPRGLPATRKACSTAIARRSCTPSPPVRPTPSRSRRAIRSWSWCHCFTPMPGACRFRPRCAARSWCFPALSSIPRASICCSNRKSARKRAAFQRSGSTSSLGSRTIARTWICRA